MYLFQQLFGLFLPASQSIIKWYKWLTMHTAALVIGSLCSLWGAKRFTSASLSAFLLCSISLHMSCPGPTQTCLPYIVPERPTQNPSAWQIAAHRGCLRSNCPWQIPAKETEWEAASSSSSRRPRYNTVSGSCLCVGLFNVFMSHPFLARECSRKKEIWSPILQVRKLRPRDVRWFYRWHSKAALVRRFVWL